MKHFDSIFTPALTEKESRQYHEVILDTLGQMERGDRVYIVITEPSGNDLDGEGLDILALGDERYHVFYYSMFQDSESVVLDEDGVIELFASVMYGIEAREDSAEGAKYDWRKPDR